ncbi:transposase [Patescibacteria group bacterium]|nr:transposase [Patescibacteria group bacterium]
MPKRKPSLETGQTYHVFNKAISLQPVFISQVDYQRAKSCLLYYRGSDLPTKYSYFIGYSRERQLEVLEKIKTKGGFIVQVLAYCLMPNHFHLLLRQSLENGISKYVSDFTNSYTRYFNTKRKREGPLFKGRFKAVAVETEEELLHVSRYIHLNPYSSHLVRDFEELASYPNSSFPEYMGKDNLGAFCDKDVVLSCFKNKNQYKEFVSDQADYQRILNEAEHALF